MSKSKGKITCRTPTSGKKATKIDRWKYDVIRSAIMNVLHREENGVLFKDLPTLVAKEISDDIKARLGSISWYTTTVKLELEVSGEIKREGGSKPQRVVTKNQNA